MKSPKYNMKKNDEGAISMNLFKNHQNHNLHFLCFILHNIHLIKNKIFFKLINYHKYIIPWLNLPLENIFTALLVMNLLTH